MGSKDKGKRRKGKQSPAAKKRKNNNDGEREDPEEVNEYNTKFLEKSVTLLTAPFEIEDEEIDDTMAAGIKRLNDRLHKEFSVSFGAPSKKDLLHQLHQLCTLPTHSTAPISNNTATHPTSLHPHLLSSPFSKKNIPLSDFPREWPVHDDVGRIDSDEVKLRKRYAELLHKASELEHNLVAAKHEVNSYKILTDRADAIDLSTLTEQSVVSKGSPLAQELAKSNILVTEIYNKISRNPILLQKLQDALTRRSGDSAETTPTDPNSVILDLFKKLKPVSNGDNT